MKTLIVLFSVISVSICACTGSSTSYLPKPSKTTLPAKEAQKIELDNMVTLDKTPYVMFPMNYRRTEESAFSSSSARTESYWNIIFYNTITNKYHLLDSTRKMVIYQYDEETASTIDIDTTAMAGWAYKPTQSIFYKIVTDDFNNDKHLTDDDPSYLFISDNEGNNLKQISPSGFNVFDWKLIDKSGKVLMQTKEDSNGDHQFSNDDQIVYYVYDLKTGAAPKPVFSKAFITQLQEQFKKQSE